MEEEKRTERVALRIAPSIKIAATELATKNGRSLSNYIEMLLRDKINENKK